MMKTFLAMIFLLAFSLPVKAAGLINIEVTAGQFPGFLCDAGSGACLGGAAGFLLDTSSGKLIAR